MGLRIMKLSLREYDAMQSGWRKWINEHMEIGGFKAWGMDFAGKDTLEVGCESGYSASLIVKDHPKSYTGMDIMPEQLEKAEALGLARRAVRPGGRGRSEPVCGWILRHDCGLYDPAARGGLEALSG